MHASKFRSITSERLKEVIQESFFFVDVLEKLGYSRTSGTMKKIIIERLILEKIDFSHITNPKLGTMCRGGSSKSRHALEEILVEDSKYRSTTRLKIRLIKAGLLTEKCEQCNLGSLWNGKKITLQLDHINGKNNDHRIENLRVLCPNCHTQTSNYGSKNRTYNS